MTELCFNQRGDSVKLDRPPITEWAGAYDLSWKGYICKSAFAHPAKFSRGLIERIYKHMLSQGWLKRGDCVVDCFGGIGTGGIVAASLGLAWIGVELEPKFHTLAAGMDCPGFTKQQWQRFYSRPHLLSLCPECVRNWQPCIYDCRQAGGFFAAREIPHAEPHRFRGNFDLHLAAWQAHGDPIPRMVQGDSRFLQANLRGVLAQAVVCSPPYHESLDRGTVNAAERVRLAREMGISNAEHISPIDMERIGKRSQGDYGTTPGQLGSMPTGSIDSIVTSPPYSSGTVHGGNGIDADKIYDNRCGPHSTVALQGGYPQSTGQLGNLPAGQVDSVVSSPPYEGSIVGGNDAEATKRRLERIANESPEKLGPRSHSYARSGKYAGNIVAPEYGTSDGQLGAEQGETFWSAARDIVSECFGILRPGGYAAFVVKSFVRDKQIVDFPGDWLRLCEACGFETVQIVHASLVKEERHPDLFGGESVKVTARKSFFRRLYERKYPGNSIDYEVVQFFKKPRVTA